MIQNVDLISEINDLKREKKNLQDEEYRKKMKTSDNKHVEREPD